MCCDPRVKGYGKYPNFFNLREDECSIDAFKILHRKCFVEMQKVSNASMLQSSSLKSNNISSNTSEERSSDALDEMDLAMVQPRPGISTAHASADAMVNRWFEYEVDFSTLITENVTKTKVLPFGETISGFLPNKLYQHIDVLNWWKVNTPEFPPGCIYPVNSLLHIKNESFLVAVLYVMTGVSRCRARDVRN